MCPSPPTDAHPTPTIENYLKTIHELGDGEGLVGPTAIAEALGVSGPTVSVTLHRIQNSGWIRRVGRRVGLTPTGLAHASSVLRRRDAGEAFLVRTLGLPREVAVRDACELEHALSPRALDALERHLGLDPQSSPDSDHVPNDARRTS